MPLKLNNCGYCTIQSGIFLFIAFTSSKETWILRRYGVKQKMERRCEKGNKMQAEFPSSFFYKDN